ncbi:MAG TPA: helicase-associated domain-containing protein [Jatrophihabitans sp.]|nr:helicase-associated domain-containing protein [Jatrophihabitans sp.]
MAVSPVSSAEDQHPGTLVDWLRSRDDRQLTRLLRLRPDLSVPAPADLAALAARVGVRSSTQRAVDALDARALATLETLVLAADDQDIVEKPDVDEPDLTDLLDRALIWGDTSRVHLTPTVRDAVGPYPRGLGRPAAVLLRSVPDLLLVPVLRHLRLPPAGQPRAGAAIAEVLADPERVAELIAECDRNEREVLDRLAAGPPVGTLRSAPLVSAEDDPIPARRLVERGLLIPIDTQRVELPREFGVLLRAADGPAPTASAPVTHTVDREPDTLDRLGTTAVRESLRLVDALADLWTAHPPALLRSGGIGVRDLRRTARELGVTDATVALIAETAYAAALINSTNGIEPVFLPSSEYDAWRGRDTARRWLVLASNWLSMTRQPNLVSQRGDRDRVIAALGPDAERGTVPTLRRHVLQALQELRPGAAPADRDEVLALLAWRAPRRAAAQRPLVEAILAEADLLGITAAGGLTGYTRTLLAGSAQAAEHALARALPDPVDHFLVQPDLTVVVPGPPTPAMGAELALLADVESTGGASVYRITERSVRRALDAGRSGEQLAAFVAAHSRTPIPQALSYLIEDAARRHGVLRAGAASAYLRCDDQALLARVLADRAVAPLGLRKIAPSIVVSQAPVSRVLEVLREANFAPAAEAPGGDVLTLGADPPRAPTRPPSRPIVTRGVADSEAERTELVRRLRAGDAQSERARRVQSVVAEVPFVTSAATMELLRRAVREERLVWLGVAEPDGTATAHELHPISLAAGYVRGYERGATGLRSYPVHRITAVRIVDEDDE